MMLLSLNTYLLTIKVNSYIFVKVFTSKLRHSRLFAIKINKTIELFNVEKRLIVAPSILIRGILEKIVTVKKTISFA